MWYTYMVEYHTDIKWMKFTNEWMELEAIMLSEKRKQILKDKYPKISHFLFLLEVYMYLYISTHLQREY